MSYALQMYVAYVHFQKTRFNEIFPSRLKNKTLIWSENQLTRDAHKCKNWGRHCRKNGRWPRIMYRSTTTTSPVESLNEAIQILFAQRGWGRYQRGHWTLKLFHFTFGVHIRLTKEGGTHVRILLYEIHRHLMLHKLGVAAL